MRSVRPLRFGAVVLLLLGSMAASLPEETVAAAGGARAEGPPRPTRVVSLGDSVPTGAQCDCSPFPVLVAADLAAPGQRVGLEQLAEDGATSDDVAATVEDDLSDFSATDVVLLEAGANDLADLADGSDPLPDEAQVDSAAAEAVATVSATVDRIVPTGARVVVLDYWAVGLDGAVADQEYTPAEQAVQDQLTDSFDDQLQAAVDAKGARSRSWACGRSSTATTGAWTPRRCWPTTGTTRTRRASGPSRTPCSRPCPPSAPHVHRTSAENAPSRSLTPP